MVSQIEEKVDRLTDKIDEETDTKIRKEKRQERSQWKKSLKLIRENYRNKTVYLPIGTAIPKQPMMPLYANERRSYEKRPTKIWI
ncbi:MULTISPECIES: hypothetical protein [unclassified Bacillus (in: firmicutes)]|uniref:hypothetical protein n=1 Tax=unclassified Bacillus (in: firmicutes) TaxID=185979 RepID=UPI00040819BC|nr:hypothetical protein [Bacillus sp. NSP9.1]QHZ46660.1 hypothetical protein M654_010295 [Bacillus sp. NSP9.1]